MQAAAASVVHRAIAAGAFLAGSSGAAAVSARSVKRGTLPRARSAEQFDKLVPGVAAVMASLEHKTAASVHRAITAAGAFFANSRGTLPRAKWLLWHTALQGVSCR